MHIKNKPKLIALATALALSFGANGWSAGAEPHKYKFEPVGHTLRLVDAANKQPVAEARVFALHRQWLGLKGQPQFWDLRIALMPIGNGSFTYDNNDVQAGATIRLVARVDDSDQDVWGSVQVGR